MRRFGPAVACQMRKWADRIDRRGAPKLMHWTFTFEHRRGIVFREDGRGCRLAYLGDDEYEKAHSESDSEIAEARERAQTRAWIEDLARNADPALRAAAGELLAAFTTD